jgi:hypothetical protein
MKTVPRNCGVFIDDARFSWADDALPAVDALALAAAAGARQRTLDLPSQEEGLATSPDEVIKLLDELKPGYRSTRVRRGNRTFLVVTGR